MPNPLLNATVGDSYTTAATISDVWQSRGGWFVVSTNGVVMQYQYGSLGSSYWGDELQLGAGSSGSLPSSATGIRFKNATAGATATVSGQIAYGEQPLLDLTFPGVSASASTYNIIGQGQTNGTHGTPTVLTASLVCVSVVVRAKPGNSGLVYLGGSSVTTSNGYELSPGDAVSFDVENPHAVYFDVDTTNDGVSWMAVG